MSKFVMHYSDSTGSAFLEHIESFRRVKLGRISGRREAESLARALGFTLAPTVHRQTDGQSIRRTCSIEVARGEVPE